ncbi:uncharacterized protein LOC128952560 [Oppia nitens]|uniref:uncharacterized protein LOC128952560 n=1 Tax=Oppia nitens TaxID=1686743 RepID=UPI0023D9ED07|nr:uncharacterized protein LOC128952560 [Oppia nitens]
MMSLVNDCPNCHKLDEILKEKTNKMTLIEVRLRDLVKAYKRVCVEKENLQMLSISSTAVLPLNDSHEQQKRLSSLEDKITEMSQICGKYESQSLVDKQLIQELTQKCEYLTNELKSKMSSVETNSSKDCFQMEKTFRHRGIQTEELIESIDENTSHASNDLPNNMKDCETQTSFGHEIDMFGTNRKKSELAVVLPTVMETEQQNNSNLDEDLLSNTSRHSYNSYVSNEDTYPVFESNSRDIPPNSEPFSIGNSSGVSLFYANELARKEIDLAEHRIQSREYECALRELQWKYNTDKYRYESRIKDLERNFSQISSNQPLNQLNITYIRNVLLKLLNTKDKQQKQFMINAILTALDQKDRKPK